MFRFLIAPRLVLLTTVALTCFRVFELGAADVLPFLWSVLTRSTVALLFFWALNSRLEVYLGRFVAWKIGKLSDGNLRWTFDRIHLSPNIWSRDGIACIEVSRWKWHNPPGFRQDDASFILQIDRLTMRFTWGSLYNAVRCHGALAVDFLAAEGLRFRTERNHEGALNLWQALNMNDDDINISVICDHARRHGGMAARFGVNDHHKDDNAIHRSASVKPLSSSATDATRNAAKYWEPTWKGREQLRRRSKSYFSRFPYNLVSCVFPPDKDKVACRAIPDDYFEFPLGDPLRRPRWGVPIRFDIKQMVVLDFEVWILDLLMMEQHTYLHDPDDMKLTLKSMAINRERLERGDDRKWGGGDLGDGVRGVYLGEIGLTIIGKLVPNVLWRKPIKTASHACHAAAYAAQDSARNSAARLLELVWFPRSSPESHMSSDDRCYVHVHLMNGRRVASGGNRLNASVEFKLLHDGSRPNGKEVAGTMSPTRLWTSKPHWHIHYHLGPVHSRRASVRVRLMHTPVRLSTQSVVVGEFAVPVERLLVEADSIDGMMVGWFPVDLDDLGFHGELKLGLRLMNSDSLCN